eukprot:Nitzschia sp. Nitz4//scaffold17_size182527//65374//69935//NITZ4_001847-RA/size182527-processed-gene-0.49-mRNA-1//-1//CDS//3329539319//7920//frame0
MAATTNNSNREVSHYVVTAHPPGSVLHTVKCNFLSPDSEDVIVGKSRRLEIRQLRQEDEVSPFPVVLSCPINGRISSLLPLHLPNHETALLFVTTDQLEYAVLGYTGTAESASLDPINATAGDIRTYTSGSLKDDWSTLGDPSECGLLVTVDPHMRCIVLHLYDGLVTVFPIEPDNPKLLGPLFHARLEDRTLLAITMLHHADPSQTPPHLSLLHQDSRGLQHVTTHAVDLQKSQLWTITSAAGQPISSKCEWLKRNRVDGGSSLLIPVPPRVPAVAKAASAQPVAGGAHVPTMMGVSSVEPSGGVVLLGQRHITYLSINHVKVMPIPPAIILSWDILPPDASGMPRFLLGDEFGNLHMLTLITIDVRVVSLQLDTLGSCTLSHCLQYLDQGLVFCGSQLGDSQLVQIHDEPIPVEDMDEDVNGGLELGETTYLSVVEEYTHLGPIVDFDLVAMAGSGEQSQVVTASGSSKSGSLRVIRNGIGMKEYASVQLSGIQDMWSLRRAFDDSADAYLVQSFVGETRVLGVTSVENSQSSMEEDEAEESTGEDMDMDQGEEEEEVGGTLEEVVLPGLESNASTLNVTNVVGNLFLQVTETQLRLADAEGVILDTVEPESPMTVAASNEAGQVLVAMRGGKVLYYSIQGDKLTLKSAQQMDREVSCLDIHPFAKNNIPAGGTMPLATLCAVGLWDDFTVRLLSLEDGLQEVLQIHLSTDDLEQQDEGQRRNNRNNMMARSLCLITLDATSSAHAGNSSKNLTASSGVDMMFVGLGDGTLISFAIVEEDAMFRAQSKKEVNLGTQRINLIPLKNEKGGSCVLATGDRPTVIYLAGMTATKNYNPKLCYSNVNLSPAEDMENNDVSRPHTHESIAVNVATPFFSPLLFEAMGQEHYSLCVADDANLRLGVIDDIQKLHVTTCQLGMAPRRIVHCPEGNMFAVGCIESGIKQVGVGGGELSMGNCIRFLNDATFDDIKRIDLEPCEMILSMISVTMRIQRQSSGNDGAGNEMETSNPDSDYGAYLIVGTAYVLHDEDEPTKGRVLVLSCTEDENDPSKRAINTVCELQVRGGVYSMCQFYDGKILITVNSKTHICQLSDDGSGTPKLSIVGFGHHGHILSLFVSSQAKKTTAYVEAESDGASTGETANEQLAIVGDMMRSISLVQYYPEHDTLEEVARDFNANWTTAVVMLSNDVYLGGENWNNLFVLRRNRKATSEEVRSRLDTIGEMNLGEMVNKFMPGSLVMPTSLDSAVASSNSRRSRPLSSPKKEDSRKIASSAGAAASSSRGKRPVVAIGSQTLFGTVDGTLGSILGLDGPTTAFFTCLERAMEKIVLPIGNFSHQRFRGVNKETQQHPSHGFVDGDLVESFLDLDKASMDKIVQQMNRDGGWDSSDTAFSSGEKNDSDETAPRVELSVDDVLAVVEEMSMLH